MRTGQSILVLLIVLVATCYAEAGVIHHQEEHNIFHEETTNPKEHKLTAHAVLRPRLFRNAEDEAAEDEAPTISPKPSMSPKPSTPSTTSVPSNSSSPSGKPSLYPSWSPSTSSKPSYKPSESKVPSLEPSSIPSYKPSLFPSISTVPSSLPSSQPSKSTEPSSSSQPSSNPSVSFQPSGVPSLTAQPSGLPSSQPSISSVPSSSKEPSFSPTDIPSISSGPSEVPSDVPTLTTLPSSNPSASSEPSVKSSTSPSVSVEPTLKPTSPPTSSPTSNPTSSPTPATPSPTQQGFDFYYWGDSKSIGREGPSINEPSLFQSDAVHVSAGSEYTMVLRSDGKAYAAGFIDPLSSYKGHLGLGPPGTVVKQGINSLILSADGLPTFTKLFAGVENTPNSGIIHTIFLDSQGKAWATGSNSKGQLCLNSTASSEYTPQLIPTPDDLGRIVDVAIGDEHTLLLFESGDVYGCGSNSVGQVGLGGFETKVPFPTKITFDPNVDIKVQSISAGFQHSLFKSEGGLYVTGSNQYGKLCTEQSKGGSIFVPAKLATPIASTVEQFKAIKESSYILYNDGSVDSCGRNNQGQLGDGTKVDNIMVEVKLDGEVTSILGTGPSAESVFFYTKDGTILGTGLNNAGQLGIGSTEASKTVPTLVKFTLSVSDLKTLSAADDHTAMVGATNTFKPTSNPSESPTISTKPTFYLAPSMAPSKSSSPTLSPSNQPTRSSSPTRTGLTSFAWGDPKSGGAPGGDDLVPEVKGGGVADASAGSEYTITINSDGTSYSAGNIPLKTRYQGHLGIPFANVIQGINGPKLISTVLVADGSTIISAPLFSKVFAGVENSVNTGDIHTILLDTRGRAWATGSNKQGQLCLGDNTGSKNRRYIPQEIIIPSGGRIVDVAIGGQHTLLVDQFGNVYGCGSNGAGQLGLGAGTSPRLVPTKINLSSVQSVSAGLSHSLFVTNSNLYVTGNNQYGQLCRVPIGQNVRVPVTLPISRGNVRQFEATRDSSYILFKDRSVDSCGRNNYGQLGDGTNTNKAIAEVKIDNVALLLGVGPSAESVFFYTQNELVFATGLNNAGQLGIGNKVNVNIPTSVKFEQYVRLSVLSAGGDHTIALGELAGLFSPTLSPSMSPTLSPTLAPTLAPSLTPTILVPTLSPTLVPTLNPSLILDTLIPTLTPTVDPTLMPTLLPTTIEPSTTEPTTDEPTDMEPTLSPSFGPTVKELAPPSSPSEKSPTVAPLEGPVTSAPSRIGLNPGQSSEEPTLKPTYIIVMPDPPPPSSTSPTPLKVSPGGTSSPPPTWILIGTGELPTPPSISPPTSKPTYIIKPQVVYPIFWGGKSAKATHYIEPKAYKPEYKPPVQYQSKSAKAYSSKAGGYYVHHSPTYWGSGGAIFQGSKSAKGSKAYYQKEQIKESIHSEKLNNAGSVSSLSYQMVLVSAISFLWTYQIMM